MLVMEPPLVGIVKTTWSLVFRICTVPPGSAMKIATLTSPGR